MPDQAGGALAFGPPHRDRRHCRGRDVRRAPAGARRGVRLLRAPLRPRPPARRRPPQASRARSTFAEVEPCALTQRPVQRPKQEAAPGKGAKKLAPRRRFGPATVKALRRIACDRSCRCIRPKYAKIEEFWRFVCHSPATVRLQSGDNPATVRRQSGDSPATVRPSGEVGEAKNHHFSNSS